MRKATAGLRSKPLTRPNSRQPQQERSMSRVTYEIVEHDGGWAYRVDGVFSETFPSHEMARDRKSVV